jgi:hypothetical protein
MKRNKGNVKPDAPGSPAGAAAPARKAGAEVYDVRLYVAGQSP